MNAWETVLQSLLRASWQGGVMVMVVLLVQRIIGARLAPRFRYLLWLPVAIRLALPLSVESSLSLFNWVPTPGAQDHPQVAASGLIAEIQPAPPVVEAALIAPPMDSRPGQPPPQTAEPTERPTLAALPPQRQPWTWMQMAAAFWLAGMAVVAAFIWIPSFRFARRLHNAAPLLDPRVRQILSGCQDRMRVRQPVVVCETDCLKTPALFGVWRPRLLLPTGLASSFSDTEMEHVFLHELAHLRRRDLMANWILTVLLVLHWFNPLVWLAMARIRIDRELACDALALMHVAERETQAYGETILKLVEAFSVGHGIPGLVGMGEDPGALRMRIGMIARFRRPGRWSALTLVLVVGLGAVGLTDARRARTPAPPRPATVPTTENAPLSDPTRYRVQVIDEQTKRPIAGAMILTSHIPVRYGWKRLSAKTDASGLAELDLSQVLARSEQPEVELTIAHPNYAPSHAVRAIRPESAGRPEDYDLSVGLGKGRTIGGQLVDADGKPIAGATIYLWLPNVPWPTKAAKPQAEVVPLDELSGWSGRTVVETDRSGHWHLERVPNAVSWVEIEAVRKDGARRLFTTSRDFFARDPKQLIEVGTLVQQTALLQWTPGRDLELTLRDELGQPIPNAAIYDHWHPFEYLGVRTSPGSIGELRVDGRADARGGVVLRDREGVERMVIAAADGYALKFQVASLTNGTPRSREVAVLQRSKPLRLRLTDESGAALVGAQVSTVYQGKRTAEMVPWSGVTDSQGAVVWDNAPYGSFPMRISKAGQEMKEIEVKSTRELQTFTTRPFMPREAIQLTFKVVDSADGSAIPKFDILVATEPGIVSRYGALMTGRQGSAELRLDHGGPSWDTYRLKITSPGYQPFVVGGPHRYAAGDQAFSVALDRSNTPRFCTVLQPDGNPAAGAKLYRQTGAQGAFFPEYDSPNVPPGVEMIEAGANGEIIPPVDVPTTPILVMHSGGVAVIMLEAMHHSTLRLQPWGRIEVDWKTTELDPSVVKSSLLSLQYLPRSLVYVHRSLTSDTRGHVRFDHVQPGDYIIQREDGSRNSQMGVDQHSVRVKPGDALHLTLGADGVPVVGTLLSGDQTQPPAASPSTPPFFSMDSVAVLVRKLKPPPFPISGDYASNERYWEAVETQANSEEAQNYAREVRTYLIKPAEDGSFRTENVRPGVYQIRMGVGSYALAHSYPARFGPDVGQLAGEVTIPETPERGSRTLIDVGIIVPPAVLAAGSSGPLLQFAGQDPRGRRLSLGSYRGRWVLLNFWASWSERSLEAIEGIREVHQLSGAGSKFEVVGVSLDEDQSQVRRAVETHSMSWPQIVLSREERGRLLLSLDLKGLPRCVLLDQEGRILSKDLTPRAALATLRRLISRN